MSNQVVKVKRDAIAACMTCPLCHKLLRDATTISECLHTFCRKCIYKKLSDEEWECCPLCQIDLGCVPLEKLRLDHNLQDVRAKIFPYKRLKVNAPEILPSVTHPARRKERSLSSLVVSTPRVSTQVSLTGRRSKSIARKPLCGSSFSIEKLAKKEDDSAEDRPESSGSPETLTEFAQNLRQNSSSAEPFGCSMPDKESKNGAEPWDASVDLWDPLNCLVQNHGIPLFEEPALDPILEEYQGPISSGKDMSRALVVSRHEGHYNVEEPTEGESAEHMAGGVPAHVLDESREVRRDITRLRTQLDNQEKNFEDVVNLVENTGRTTETVASNQTSTQFAINDLIKITKGIQTRNTFKEKLIKEQFAFVNQKLDKLADTSRSTETQPAESSHSTELHPKVAERFNLLEQTLLGRITAIDTRTEIMEGQLANLVVTQESIHALLSRFVDVNKREEGNAAEAKEAARLFAKKRWEDDINVFRNPAPGRVQLNDDLLRQYKQLYNGRKISYNRMGFIEGLECFLGMKLWEIRVKALKASYRGSRDDRGGRERIGTAQSAKNSLDEFKHFYMRQGFSIHNIRLTLPEAWKLWKDLNSWIDFSPIESEWMQDVVREIKEFYEKKGQDRDSD